MQNLCGVARNLGGGAVRLWGNMSEYLKSLKCIKLRRRKHLLMLEKQWFCKNEIRIIFLDNLKYIFFC